MEKKFSINVPDYEFQVFRSSNNFDIFIVSVFNSSTQELSFLVFYEYELYEFFKKLISDSFPDITSKDK